MGARASLGVGSKAMGGDLARLGACGASVSGGEEEDAAANAMVVPVAWVEAYFIRLKQASKVGDVGRR